MQDLEYWISGPRSSTPRIYKQTKNLILPTRLPPIPILYHPVATYLSHLPSSSVTASPLPYGWRFNPLHGGTTLASATPTRRPDAPCVTPARRPPGAPCVAPPASRDDERRPAPQLVRSSTPMRSPTARRRCHCGFALARPSPRP